MYDDLACCCETADVVNEKRTLRISNGITSGLKITDVNGFVVYVLRYY